MNHVCLRDMKKEKIFKLDEFSALFADCLQIVFYHFLFCLFRLSSGICRSSLYQMTVVVTDDIYEYHCLI